MKTDNKAFWRRVAKLYGPVMERSGAKLYRDICDRIGPCLKRDMDVLDIKTPRLIQFNYSYSRFAA